MRLPAALALAALLVPALAAASEPSVTLLAPRSGSFLAGGPIGVEGVNAATFPLRVDACHRQVLVDLEYTPSERTVDVEGVGAVDVLSTFRVELRQGLAVVRRAEIVSPGPGHPMGAVPAGDYAFVLALAQGADVGWTLRVRGWEVPGEPACLPDVRISEVEADPAGEDAGAEWVEVWNREATTVDLSGWELRAGPDGRTFLLPGGTLVPAGARLVVPITGDAFLANEGETLALSLLGIVRDEAPPLADQADDARTWQRNETGGWSFAPGTPGVP